MIVCPELSSKSSHRIAKHFFETLSLPGAKILSPVARQAPTKIISTINFSLACQLEANKARKLLLGKTPWVDQACADCPGFLVPAAGGALPPELHPRASGCVPEIAVVFMGPSSKFLDLLPPAPLPPVQKRDAQHTF